MKKRKPLHSRRRGTIRRACWERYGALPYESRLIQRAVDDMLKDRELREKIDYYARQILKAIAAKL